MYAPGFNNHQFQNFWLLKGANQLKFIGKCQLFVVPHASAEQNVHEWANLFKEGPSSVEDEDRPGATVSDWLRHQSKDFCSEGIRKIVHKWKKCETVLRDYVDK